MYLKLIKLDSSFFRLFSALFLLSLSACGGSTSAFSKTSGSQIEPPGNFTGERPQIIAGWLDEYSRAIEENIAKNYPDLLSLEGSRMSTVCPDWASLSGSEREIFWSSLLWSIAAPESGRNRTSIYRETTMSIDSITGQQIRSEGLLQLSYVDVVSYAYTGHDISWTADRVMALTDYANGLTHGNPARTILNAYSNLNLGLWIMHKRLAANGATELLETALGHYWSTMRVTGSGFSTVLKNLKIAMPTCFR